MASFLESVFDLLKPGGVQAAALFPVLSEKSLAYLAGARGWITILPMTLPTVIGFESASRPAPGLLPLSQFLWDETSDLFYKACVSL